jgi:GDP-L-fucose synthase
LSGIADEIILITGASGVIGTALATELEASASGRIITLSSKEVDLTDFPSTAAIFQEYRPSVVYHLAARVCGIMGNLRAQGQAYFDNVRINTNTIEAARLAGARKIVAMGSAAIYSDQVALPMREEDIWQGVPHGSEAGYAHAKRGMLAQLQAYRDQYGLDYAYCISTNLFGPHDRFDEANGHVLPSLISKFHRAIEAGTPVTVWGSGTPERDFFYAPDAARAMRLIGETFTGPINLASGIHISIQDTAALIAKVSGYDRELNWDRTKPDGQRLRDYDVSKLKALGFKPAFTLEAALRETFDWYSKNANVARR